MKTFRLDVVHIVILRAIDAGAYQQQMASQAGISAPAVVQRLAILEREGYIKREPRSMRQTWQLTKLGQAALQGASTTFSITQQKEENVHDNLKSQKEISSMAKRANGFKLYLDLLRTEYPRLEATLHEAGFQVERHAVRNSYQYIVREQGYELTFTTRKLILRCPDKLYKFKFSGKVIINRELNKALRFVAAFNRKAHIRFIEENGKLQARLPHYEIGHTNSKVARELTEQRKGFIPLAFDTQTLLIVAWADRSLRLHELEFSDVTLEAKVADMLQDMHENKWIPRQEQKKLRELMKIVEKSVNNFNVLSTSVSHLVARDLQRPLDEQPTEKKRFKRAG
jgi:DNA-binding MarR family transcriptional regulator